MNDHQNSYPLARKVAVVTGTAQGIGQAIAVRLARAGAAVVGVDVNDQSQTAEGVERVGGAWTAHALDITDRVAVEALAADVGSSLGRLDILVNNAAIDDAVGFDYLDRDRWDRVIDVNLNGPFNLIKAVVPIMRQGSYGRIINIASGSVVHPMPGFIAYRAAKMGLIGMTRALSNDLGPDGITVNVVSPGVTDSPMAAASLSETFREAAIARQGVKRSGLPDDVAHTIAFLASPEAEFVTGQTMMVNGGAAYT